jgi:hypothetical protein
VQIECPAAGRLIVVPAADPANVRVMNHLQLGGG